MIQDTSLEIFLKDIYLSDSGPAHFDEKVSAMDLDREIEYAAHIAGSVLSKLVTARSVIFPSRKEAWYQPDGADQPK